jgi:hypothetical protein
LNFLEVTADVCEAGVKALERLELSVDAGAERADGNVTDVAEEVLDTNFFGLFGFDYGGGVYEGFCCCGTILNIREKHG